MRSLLVYVPVKLSNKDKMFENQIFDYLSSHQDEWNNATYVGIIGYSYWKKSTFSLNEMVSHLKDGKIDVLGLQGVVFHKTNERVSLFESLAYLHGS